MQQDAVMPLSIVNIRGLIMTGAGGGVLFDKKWIREWQNKTGLRKRSPFTKYPESNRTLSDGEAGEARMRPIRGERVRWTPGRW